jgi:hypothetical protein
MIDSATTGANAEVVGLFAYQGRLDAALRQLGEAGFHGAAISVLRVSRQRGNRPTARSSTDISGAPGAPLVSPVPTQSISIAVRVELGELGVAWAATTANGALTTAIGATMPGDAVSAGFGTLLYYAVPQRHANEIHNELAIGGLMLWVRVNDHSTETRVMSVLRNCNVGPVHTHKMALLRSTG